MEVEAIAVHSIKLARVQRDVIGWRKEVNRATAIVINVAGDGVDAELAMVNVDRLDIRKLDNAN